MDGTATTTEDPYALFQDWMADATKGEINDPNAVCLATATPDGRPSARMVLLKGVDARGFVFYTNLESRKGGELAANPFAALCFHWKTLQRSIRVEGLRRMPITPPARVPRGLGPGLPSSPARSKAVSRWKRQWPNMG